MRLLQDKKREAKCISVITKEKKKPRPLPLNTVSLLKIASSTLGMGPQQTMKTAESLYMQGYISYPRTETSVYPASFDLEHAVSLQTHSSEWGSFASDLLKIGLERPKEGVDMGDHPPITPMRVANDLNGDAWRLYEYITRHFLGSVAPDAVYSVTTVRFQIGDEYFEGNGRKLLSGGFTLVMPWQLGQDEYISDFRVNDNVVVSDMAMNEKETSPPDYLTESELIGLVCN